MFCFAQGLDHPAGQLATSGEIAMELEAWQQAIQWEAIVKCCMRAHDRRRLFQTAAADITGKRHRDATVRAGIAVPWQRGDTVGAQIVAVATRLGANQAARRQDRAAKSGDETSRSPELDYRTLNSSRTVGLTELLTGANQNGFDHLKVPTFHLHQLSFASNGALRIDMDPIAAPQGLLWMSLRTTDWILHAPGSLHDRRRSKSLESFGSCGSAADPWPGLIV
jgi:hypothetical protein